jgi:hypothetical protein
VELSTPGIWGIFLFDGVKLVIRNILFILAVFVCVPIYAEGAVFYNLDDESLADSAELVVLGKVDFIKAEESFGGSIHTLVSIEVIEVLKGAYGGTHLVAKRLGGEIGGRGLAVFGAPNFTLGEEVALLLRRGDEYFEVEGMALGKFSVTPGGVKGKFLSRDTSEVTVKGNGLKKGAVPGGEMSLDAFRKLVGKSKPVNKPGATADSYTGAYRLETSGVVSLPYTYFAIPSRHIAPDIPAGLTVNTSNNPLGDATAAYDAVVAGFTGWNNVLASPILQVTGTTTSNTKGDNVRFGDPDGEIADPSSDCSGTMGYGGYAYTSSETLDVNGTTFYKAYDPYMIINDGFESGSCTQLTISANLIDIIMHEAGHMIGIGHSADSNALMYATLVNLGSYGQLGSDDIYAVRSIYPELGTGLGSIPTLSEWGAIILVVSMIGVFVIREMCSQPV